MLHPKLTCETMLVVSGLVPLGGCQGCSVRSWHARPPLTKRLPKSYICISQGNLSGKGRAPYAVKHQAVYTNTRIYREGETPLCLQDVSNGCQPNAVLNTSNENDNMYDLHVPVDTAKTGDNSSSTRPE